jgi:nitrous oxidase accessory protein NosD
MSMRMRLRPAAAARRSRSRRVARLLLAASLAVGLIVIGVQPAGAVPATLVVDEDGFASATDCNALTPAFPTISAAEAAASPGDTIKVCPGLYNEMVFIDVDDLTILGAQAGADARTRLFVAANESIVDHPCGPVQISADRVTLDGFTVQGSTLSDPCFLSGIWTNPGFGGTQGGHQILNNIVQNNISGIELDSTCVNPTLVQFNLIQNNNNPGPGSGNAIQTNFGLCNATIDSNRFSGHTNSSFLVVAPSSNLDVTNNELVGGTPERIVFGSVATSTISGNVSIGSTSSATIRLFGGDSDITIEHNTLRNGMRGIRVDDLGFGINTNVDAHFNCIQGNSIAGLQVDSGAHPGPLDAQNNWWGSASGPTTPSNPGGTGDAIIDPDGVVDFTPWLLSPTGTGPSCPPPPPPPPPPAFKATGGGQIDVSGGRGSFGFNAKRENGTTSGHLTYMNHVTGANLNCTVTAALVTSSTVDFSGPCSSKSSAGSFTAHAEDNGEPGKGVDVFRITYGPTEGGPLRAGNIQVHRVP